MPESIRVLHVDDDPAFLDMSAEFLSGRVADFSVETETSVDAGLARLADVDFDCVVSDYQLPERDGLAFLEAVRDRHPHLPFILFTGQGSEQVAGEAVTKGATDYLQKAPGSDQYRLLANRVGNAVESHRARRELRRYRTLVETVGDAMYVLDEAGTVTLANEAMAAMLGTDRSDVVGSHATSFMAEGDYERGTELIVEILEDPDRNWGTFEMTVVTSHDRRIPGEISVAPLVSEGGEYEATVGVVRDITERKQRADRLRSLHETTRDLIDADDVAETVTRAVAAANEVLELEAVAFFAPGDEAAALEPVAASAVDASALDPVERGGGPVWRAYEAGEAIFASGADETIDALDAAVGAHSAMILPTNGQGVLVAGSPDANEFEETTRELARVLASNLGRAIGSQRREERLRERERELQRSETIVEVMGDGVYALDPDARFTYVNRHLVEAVGVEREDLLGEPPTTVVEDLDVEGFEEDVAAVLSGERTSFTREVRIDPVEGEAYPAEVNVAPILSDGEFQGTVGVVRDVRDRRKRKEQLELYETAVESTMDGVAIVDAGGDYLLANQVFADAFGLDAADIEGTSATSNVVARETEAPDDITARYEDALAAASEEGSSQFRYESTVEVDGSEETFENLVTATRRDDGSVVFVVSTRHITDRKERARELERQNERLDEFARVVSHDLRTPLGVASGRLELAAEECDSEHLAAVEDALDRMNALIDETLTMARQGRTVSETEPVDLDEMIPACWEAIDAADATLALEAAPTIRADRGRLRQVVENLFHNAVEHGSTSPPSRAREDAVEHGGPAVSVRVGSTADGIFVADDGPGVPADERADVFSPGYTTGEEGNGFGLAIVNEIVEAHGWEIELTESDEGGARFELTGLEVVD